MRYLERLIQDMLLFVKGARLSGEVFLLAPLVEELAQTLEPHAATRHIALRLDAPAAGLMLKGDRQAISGALINLLETALLEPAAESWLDAGPEPLAHFADGEVRIALFDPGAWHARYAPGAADCSALERGFEYFQARQRQFAAVLEAHAVPVQYVHCADGNADCLR